MPDARQCSDQRCSPDCALGASVLVPQQSLRNQVRMRPAIEPTIEGASPCQSNLATSHRCWRQLPRRRSPSHQLPQPMRLRLSRRRLPPHPRPSIPLRCSAPPWAVQQPNARRPAMFRSTMRPLLFTTSLRGTIGMAETQYRHIRLDRCEHRSSERRPSVRFANCIIALSKYRLL